MHLFWLSTGVVESISVAVSHRLWRWRQRGVVVIVDGYIRVVGPSDRIAHKGCDGTVMEGWKGTNIRGRLYIDVCCPLSILHVPRTIDIDCYGSPTIKGSLPPTTSTISVRLEGYAVTWTPANRTRCSCWAIRTSAKRVWCTGSATRRTTTRTYQL